MLRTVIFHRRVQKKLKEKLRPVASQVVECVKSLSAGQTDHLGLRMKRLKGIDRPVFEARVNRDVRMIFTVQPAHQYSSDNGEDRDHLLPQIVVWDVDHHDDALNAARCLSYDAFQQAEHLNLPIALHGEGVMEEVEVSKLPDYPSVPISVVESAMKTGKSVLTQYLRPQYRGEEWWFQQALSTEQESLRDAQEFWEIDLDCIDEELERFAQSDEDFLLRLLPEQMEFVRMPGPLLLSGTVGSGKTTIMLYHLYRRARTNPAGRYLVVTYSPTLRNLCQLLFEHLPHGRELLERVDILSYEDLLRRWFPNAEIVSYNERRQQFHEAYQRARGIWKQGKLPQALKEWKRIYPLFPWDEETLWAEYWDTLKGQMDWGIHKPLTADCYVAASNLPPEQRELAGLVLGTWFQLEGTDELDLSRMLWEQIDTDAKTYDGVYVDEVQDLCEVQWALLLRLVKQVSDLFLAGDPFQALRPSGFRWRTLKRRLRQEITIHDESLELNLRNSKQIAQFVQKELQRLKAQYELDELPDYHVTAMTDGLPPVALTTETHVLEPTQLAHWLSDQGAVVVWDEAEKGAPLAQGLLGDGVLVCTVDEAKGLEFDRVVLYNIYARLHEQMGKSTVLRQQAFSRLYVALTRARRGLIVVEDKGAYLPPEMAPLTPQWWESWNVAEKVVVRSCDAASRTVLRKSTAHLEAAGRFAEAARICEQVGLYRDAARCYELAKDYANAARCYEQAGQSQDAARCWARWYQQQGRFLEAGAWFEKAGLLSDAARCYKRARDYTNAARCYEQANDYANAARCYELAGDYAKAGHCYELAGHYAKAGHRYELVGDYANAARCYEQAGQSQDAARCWARWYQQQGRFLEAGAWFEKAGLLSDAARCYKQAGDYAKAARCYEQAGDYAEALRYFAKCQDMEATRRCVDKLMQGYFGTDGTGQISSLAAQEIADGLVAAAHNLKSILPHEATRIYTRAARYYEIAGEFGRAGELYEQTGYLLLAEQCYIKANRRDDVRRLKDRRERTTYRMF